MSNVIRATVFCAMGAWVLVWGCVRTGDIDPAVINRYQQHMARRKPAVLRGSTGLDVFRPVSSTGGGPELTVSADPNTQSQYIELTLTEAVMRALSNNPEVQVVSYNPGIAREEIIKAAAEFDYVVSATLSYEKDDDRANTTLGGGQTRSRGVTAAIKQKTITGANWSLVWTLARDWDNSTASMLSTRYEPVLAFGITQPLLRDAWGKFNLAELRIARVQWKGSIEQFRQKVEEIVSNVFSTYWALVRVRKERDIHQELVDMADVTLKRVMDRREVDAHAVHIEQATAELLARRASLVRAEKNVLDIQDSLARLLADPQLNIIGNYEIRPATSMTTAKVRLDPTDQLLSALQYSPFLAQARLAIREAELNVVVAANQKLPKVDLTATTGVQGLGGSFHQAKDQFFSGDYVSYGLALKAEYPIGNRERRAQHRRRKLEYQKSVANMQDSLDQVSLLILRQIRQVETSYQEMQFQRKAMEAFRRQLEALTDREQTERLTPSFLDLKLRTQSSMATAEVDTVRAIVAYNTAIVELSRTTGTILESPRVRITLPAVLGETARNPQ